MLWFCLCSRNIRNIIQFIYMSIKKQIVLDEKDYDELVNYANLSDDEIKREIASALTTDMIFSFDSNVDKKGYRKDEDRKCYL